MIHRWQPLALAAAVSLTVCAGAATAQTVIVRGAPAGTPIELAMNGATVATATANTEGLATLTLPPSSAVATETAARVFVDRCGEMRRVLLVDNPISPDTAAGCVRQPIAGSFVLRSVTTFVVDVAGPVPALWLTQGRAPAAWLTGDGSVQRSVWGPSPTGFVLFGGPGMAFGSNLNEVACGSGASCVTDTSRRSYAVGAAYWFTPFVAAEAQYVSPTDATVDGTATGLRFNSALRVRLLTVAGTVGAPLGRLRLYGRAGMNRHGATLRTTQTVDDSSVTVNGEPRTIPGATQTLELRTEGWGYLFGGGGEVWLSRWLAVYGDLNRAALKGSALDNPDGTIDDRVWLVQFGARVRLGR